MKIKLLGFIICILFLSSCEKDEEFLLDPKAELKYSVDSVLFDTVFTSVGSTSRRIKIYNPHAKAILISEIKLNGNLQSPFSVNINGSSSPSDKLIKLNGKDSINIFVKVQINPNQNELPFLIQDSLEIYYGENKKTIPLLAYGQNAHFITNQVIEEDTTWDAKIPYVIYKSLTVAEGATLNLRPGTKMLFHSNATLHIKGRLTALGTLQDSIVFASDRLESMYQNEPGQWNGIHFYNTSKDSELRHVVLKNAVAGITFDGSDQYEKPEITISNSVIKNMQVVGFLGYNAKLQAFNNLFYNCGQYLLYGVGGGTYNLKHNTFVGFNPNFARQTASLFFSDFISPSTYGQLIISMQNNIVHGQIPQEFVIEKKGTSNLVLSNITHNALNTTDFNWANQNNFLNQDPLFVAPFQGNFQLRAQSPVLNKGKDLQEDPYFKKYLSLDAKNQIRLFPSDLGSYERK
ncbi:MAG: hypothetical protein EOO99_04455 [Pedobacter sp.]|nr:MAG: hypothetical protein EOO99_04455 [Pedobacter sp.]